MRLPDSARLPLAEGLRAPLSCLSEARFGIVFGSIGAARDCLETALAYASERTQFGRPVAGFQLTQQKLADMSLELSKGLLLALHLARLKEAGTLRPEQVSVGKLNNVREAIAIARECRTILGGAGITLDYSPLRHASNLESVLSYEGTSEIHTLVIGQALTGLPLTHDPGAAPREQEVNAGRMPLTAGYRAGVTLALDILLLSVDPDLRIVRQREYTGYAMRAADLVELTVARRVETRGRWLKWIHVLDAQPTGEPLLDASLAALATSRQRIDAASWMCRQPGRGVVTDGLARLETQEAVRLYSRRLNSRLTLIEPALLDPARQAQVRARLDRFAAAGAAADVLDWALAGLVHECDLWIPGHFDRAAQRRYKEAARGRRGTDLADPVEATIRVLMGEAHKARNVDLNG